MDDEHWGLLATLAEIGDAIRTGAAEDRTKALLGRLHAESAEHFAAEEREMAASRYPATSGHVAQHRRFLGELARLVDPTRQGGQIVTSKDARHLETWFERHVKLADLPLAEWLLQPGQDRARRVPEPRWPPHVAD
jgi:hemerythrin-like metal-binding protein